MKLFSKKTDTAIGSSIKRISNMDTAALKSWFDTTLLGLGSAYDRWRYHGAPEDDVSQHLDALNELWQELQKRNQ